MIRADSSKPPSSWEATALWKAITANDSPDYDAVKLTLRRCMPDIERVLVQGGGSPTDFTLHDAGHGYRVAERMATIVPVDLLQSLSPYELAFLLMSAYLHDIGMTPEL